jgi:GNAT superfamily N-acetyltransferase
MRIRAATPSEVETLGGVALAAKASWGYSGAQLTEWHSDLVPTAESVRRQPTFAAELGNEVVGFCQLSVAPARAQLEHLWVHPRHMRKGTGKLLLAHALQYLAHLGIAFVEIDSDPNAEPFYVACGAVRVGIKAAPIHGEPHRTRPQLRLPTGAT